MKTNNYKSKEELRKKQKEVMSPIPVFGQLITLIRRVNVEGVILKMGSDRYSKKFKTKEHLYSMMMAIITGAKSLRELCSIFTAHRRILHHFGMNVIPKRSTLSYVNKTRISEVFERIYNLLYHEFRKYFWTA